MTTSHIQQPAGSSLCGHCCIAMVLGVTLEQAIAIVGTKGALRNKQVAAAVRSRLVNENWRLDHWRLDQNFKGRCLIRIRWPVEPGRKHPRHHLVLLAHGQVFDPLYALPSPTYAAWHDFTVKQHGARLISWLPITDDILSLTAARITRAINRSAEAHIHEQLTRTAHYFEALDHKLDDGHS